MKRVILKGVIVAMMSMGAINANAGLFTKLIVAGVGAGGGAALAASKKCADPEVAAKSKICQMEAKMKEKYEAHKEAKEAKAASAAQATK
ncbi:MAG TPA: hypothetical protein VM577_09335 [Anaerovoracaceae bacterium]|nr:hypothetical protein [Anaerovoracaceae bacterium]